jgi:hypothetical protein
MSRWPDPVSAPETVNAMIEAWLLGNNVPDAPGAAPSRQDAGSDAGTKPSMVNGGS